MPARQRPDHDVHNHRPLWCRARATAASGAAGGGARGSAGFLLGSGGSGGARRTGDTGGTGFGSPPGGTGELLLGMNQRDEGS